MTAQDPDFGDGVKLMFMRTVEAFISLIVLYFIWNVFLSVVYGTSDDPGIIIANGYTQFQDGFGYIFMGVSMMYWVFVTSIAGAAYYTFYLSVQRQEFTARIEGTTAYDYERPN